ncbi:MAG: CDP-alcohol phosphatidyltransferase family protein [Chloroflexota bacterium]
MDLYRSKARVVGGLEPILHALERRGVSPDAVTLAAVPVGVLAGGCILASPVAPVLLLAVPLLAALRLVLNLLDGALARRIGRTHARGEFYNEVGDRVADLAFVVPVAFVPGANASLVLLGALGAVMASYAGLASRAAGGERIYRGMLSKPGRMVLIGTFAILAFVVGPGAWGLFSALLLVGTALTAVERVVVAVRQLD